MSTKNSEYVQIGSLIFATAYDDEGNQLPGQYKTDAEGKKIYKFKLDKNVQITINGKDVTGQTLYVDRPINKYRRMANKNRITPEKLEEMEKALAPGGKLEFVQLEVTAKF